MAKTNTKSIWGKTTTKRDTKRRIPKRTEPTQEKTPEPQPEAVDQIPAQRVKIGPSDKAKLREAIRLISDEGRPSISTTNFQTYLQVGFARALRIMTALREVGAVAAADGKKPSEILRREVELSEFMFDPDLGEEVSQRSTSIEHRIKCLENLSTALGAGRMRKILKETIEDLKRLSGLETKD